MSLHTALQVVGLLAAGYFLIVVFLAIGPIGLFVFGPLLVIGAAQVYRNRARRGDSEQPNYCRHCGEAVDTDAFGGEREGDNHWEVQHCSNCGTPLESATESDRGADTADGTGVRTKNCPTAARRTIRIERRAHTAMPGCDGYSVAVPNQTSDSSSEHFRQTSRVVVEPHSTHS